MSGVNELCQSCAMKCKQYAGVKVVTCKIYKAKKQGRKFETKGVKVEE